MPKQRVPSYRLHKPSGQAIVRLNGRMHYLGKYGSDESRQEYDRLMAEWLAHGRQTSEQATSGWNVTQLVVAYLTFAASYYVKDGKPTDEVACIKSAMKMLRRLYGDEPVDTFGPKKLKAVRQTMIDDDWSRDYINKSVHRIRRCIRWGVACEQVPAPWGGAEMPDTRCA